MDPNTWTDRNGRVALTQIKANPVSYVGASRIHALDREEGPGALFATVDPDRAIFTFYLSQSDARAFFRDQGKGWLRWYKRCVRPQLRTYDPRAEAVVLTNQPSGPRATIVSLHSTSQKSRV